MKLKAKIASTILIIDTFFLSFAYGFNSRHVLVVDSTLPPYVAKAEVKADADLSKNKKDVKSDTANDTAKSDTVKNGATSTAGGADTKTSPATETTKKSVGSSKHGSKKSHGTK